MRTIAILCFGVICAITQTSLALRCGNSIIEEGDSQLKVLKACGEPNLVNPSPFSFYSNEVWQYNRGPDKFMTSIKFRNGEVIIIKDTGYGL